MSRAKALKNLLNSGRTIMIPGAYDAITAKVIERVGFEAVYCTGAGTVNGMTGLPDIGLATMTEMVQNAGWMSEAVGIPVISDADTGYGNAVNVMRTVREFEKAGVAGIHLEDQVFPKKCGHVEGKQVVPVEEMVGKIKAAIAARKDPDFLIIARVDANAVNGLSDALDRARAYHAAGADMIFPEALQSREEFARFAKALPGVRLFANMTEFGKTPYMNIEEFAELGYRFVIYPMTVFRVMLKAVFDAMEQLKKEGTQKNMLDRMKTRAELYDLIQYDLFAEYEKKFGPGSAG